MRHTSPKMIGSALAFTATLLTCGLAPSSVLADDTATPPGPATQPPPAPGNTQPAPTQPAAPDTATPAPNYKIQYTGLIDGYYLYQFRNPRHNDNLGGQFLYNDRHNAPTLSLAELNVFENAQPNGLGFKATLIAGDTAEINHFGQNGIGVPIGTSGSGESRFKNIQQLYATYALGGDGAGIDFGKFYTPFGYETTEATGDYNYSRSLPYDLVPFYHGGARIYTPNALSVPGLTATFYLVNSLYTTPSAGVQDDNKQPAFIGQLNYADPKGKFSLISELGMAKDKITTGFVTTSTNARTLVTDNNFTYNFSSTVLAGLDYVYASIKPNGGDKAVFNGVAVYFRQQFTPKSAYALRVSGYNGKFDMPETPNARPYEVTTTYEYKAAANFTTRLEYRHDNANGKGLQVFAGSDGTATESNQDTVSVSGLFTF